MNLADPKRLPIPDLEGLARLLKTRAPYNPNTGLAASCHFIHHVPIRIGGYITFNLSNVWEQLCLVSEFV